MHILFVTAAEERQSGVGEPAGAGARGACQPAVEAHG